MVSATNLKLENLPRIAIIGTNGVINEDRNIKNVNSFDLQRDLINNIGKKEFSKEEVEKIEKFIFMENDAKRKVVKSMNIYLKKKDWTMCIFMLDQKYALTKRE